MFRSPSSRARDRKRVDHADLERQRLISSLSGIGLESSILFAQEGANILLVDINVEAAQRAAEIINRKHPNAKVLAIKTDVGQEAEVKAAVDTAIKEFGRLDIMVLSILS